MTLAHRRAVDRVRSERSHVSRELRAATAVIDYDDVTEAVEASLDAERVQRCLTSLTELQRECVSLAYYGGYTYAGSRRAARRPGRDGQDPDARRTDQAQGLPGGAAMTSDRSRAAHPGRRVRPRRGLRRGARQLLLAPGWLRGVPRGRQRAARGGGAPRDCQAVRPRPELREPTIQAAYQTGQLAPVIVRRQA